MSEEGSVLDAGDFATWLIEMNAALRGDSSANVPCGECTACCTSSQFIHIEPNEKETLAAIPKKLLFPAPGLPTGHRLMGYDERGHCPMFRDGACTIYDSRPRTCRTYDCRLFAATHLAKLHPKADIANQSARWKFQFSTPEDRVRLRAVRSAEKFLRTATNIPVGEGPLNLPQRALLALKIHHLFLKINPTTGRAQLVEPTSDAVKREMKK